MRSRRTVCVPAAREKSERRIRNDNLAQRSLKSSRKLFFQQTANNRRAPEEKRANLNAESICGTQMQTASSERRVSRLAEHKSATLRETKHMRAQIMRRSVCGGSKPRSRPLVAFARRGASDRGQTGVNLLRNLPLARRAVRKVRFVCQASKSANNDSSKLQEHC